jgi:hypothetical protein
MRNHGRSHIGFWYFDVAHHEKYPRREQKRFSRFHQYFSFLFPQNTSNLVGIAGRQNQYAME